MPSQTSPVAGSTKVDDSQSVIARARGRFPVRAWKIAAGPLADAAFQSANTLLSLAFVAASTSTRTDIFAVDSGGHVAWSAAPGGFVSALAADPGRRILYTASLLQLTNGPSIQLLTGYAETDGAVRSAVVAQIPSFVSVSSLGFSNDLVFGTQSNDHGEGGIGAFAMHPESGALAWSGDGNVTAITPSAVVPVT